MAQLERSEDSPLPATAPNVLEIRQETDAPSLDRTVPSVSKPKVTPAPIEPKPVADGTPLPVPKRESVSIIDSFTRSIESTRLYSDANNFMARARAAELKGDLENKAFLEQQADVLFNRASEVAPPISSLKDVETLPDTSKLIAAYFGQATPSVLLSIAAGSAGGIGGRFLKPFLKSVPVLQRKIEFIGAGAATATAMHGDVKGSIVAQQQADPVISSKSVEQRERSANLTTAISLGLESIIPTMIGARVGRKLGGGINRSITPDDLLKVNKGAAIRNIGGEGLTEISQLALEEVSFELQNPDRPNTADFSDYLDTLFAGIAGGIQGHAGGRALERLGSIISQRGGAKGIIDNAFSDNRNRQAGHISFKNIQGQRSATTELFEGANVDDMDVFGTFLPDIAEALKANNITNLAQTIESKELANIQDPELRKRIQAAGILALSIDNPNITDEAFQINRQYTARILFPGYTKEDALEIIDSMFDVYVDANADISSSVAIQDTSETSEENIEFRESDLAIDDTDEVDTLVAGQGGDLSNLSIKLKTQDVQDIWARPGQAARPSESETSVINRPAFNNAPWEMDILQKEIDANPQSDKEPVTEWLARNNHDPIEYAKFLLEDLYERRSRNRQDPQAILEEKGTDTEKGTPYTKEEVISSIQFRIDNLENVLDMSEQEGGPRAVLQHLKHNYSKGAVKSISPSQDLNLTIGDLRDFSKLNRRDSGQKSREATQSGRLFPLIKNAAGEFEIHPSAINTGKKGKKQIDGWVAESIAQTIAAKGRSGKNVFQSGSKFDDLNFRRMFSEGIAAAINTLNIVGFLDPKSIKKGKVVGPIVPFELRYRDKTGTEVGDPRLAIPDVPINRSFQKAADVAVTRESKFQKGETFESEFNREAEKVALEEFDKFDKTGMFKKHGLNNASKFMVDALHRIIDAIPGGVRRDLGRNKTGRAFQNVTEHVRRNIDEKDTSKGSVASAIKFVDQMQETIDGVVRRIRGYEADIQNVKTIVQGKYNKTKLKGEFEFHTSKRTTFDTIGEARSFSSKLFRTKKALENIKNQLTNAQAASDERVEEALQDSPEGLYTESTIESLSKLDTSTLVDDIQFDPARKDTLGRKTKPGKKEQERLDTLTKPKRPTVKDASEEKIIPLSKKRIPAAIPILKKKLSDVFPVDKGSKEAAIREHFRIFLTDGNRASKKDSISPLLSAGVLTKDIQASDIGYLMIGNLTSITTEGRNRTGYFNNLIKQGATIYLASASKISLDEFTEHMDSLGYSSWTSDLRMFVPINPRIMARLNAKYEQALADYNSEQSRIQDAIDNPGESLDAQQAAQRARTWGGKDEIEEARKALASNPTKNEIKDIIKNIKRVLIKNQEELEAAITNLSDFGSVEARDTFYAYIKNLDFSDDAQRARKDLHRTIHGNRRVITQMKKLLGADKYPLTKKQQVLIESDPDYAIAVAYQMWANGDLKVSDTTLSWFKKIITSFLNILGITLSHQFGEHIMTAFQTGDLKTISDVRTVYRIQTRTFDSAYRSITNELTTLGRKVVRGSTDVLRDTNVPELMALADSLQVSETNDKKSELGFLPARRMMQGQFNTALSQIADKYTNNELEAGFVEFHSGKVTTRAGRAIRDLNTKLYKYMEDAGIQVLNNKRKAVSISTRNRRPPIVFNVSNVSKNRAGFIKKLKKVGLLDSQAEEILTAVLWNDGSLDLSDTKFDLGRPPKGEELYSGLLDPITKANRHELKEFENSDPLLTYYTFIRQATHRAEMTRYLGHNGSKIEQALEVAKVKGLSRDQIEFIRTRTIPALLGTLSYNMSPQLRKIQGGILTVQNLAILPLALFASVVDIMGIPLRTGNMSDAWKAFKSGIKGITNPSNDPDFNMAEILGINDGQMLYDRIGDTYNELIDSPWLRKINHKFFLLNGLEGWTKGMRVSAMRSAISYLTDHRNNVQKLKDIGLKKSDLSFTSEGLLDIENNRKIQEAVFNFVDSAVLRPSASHRPAWGSDPRFLLIWHLKQFTFSFHNVFYKRVANSIMEHGWKNATLIPFLAMIPIMIASDFARNIIAPSAHYESLTFMETILRAVQRSSIAGIGTFGFDMVQDVKFDEYPGTSLLGPTFDSADKFVDSGLSSGLFRLTPGYALTKTWID